VVSLTTSDVADAVLFGLRRDYRAYITSICGFFKAKLKKVLDSKEISCYNRSTSAEVDFLSPENGGQMVSDTSGWLF